MGRKHAMGVNGRRTDIVRSDVLEAARRASISRRDALATLEQVSGAMSLGLPLLQRHEIPTEAAREIARFIKTKQSVFFDSGS